MARDTDVRWGEEKAIDKVIEELARRGGRRTGVIGPLGGPRWRALEAKFELVSLDADYIKLRLVQSAEEIPSLRIRAPLSDAGMGALVPGPPPRLTGHRLGHIIQHACSRHRR